MAIDPKRLEELFQAAVQLSGGARVALVEHGCAGDVELRGRLEALLKAHDDPGELPDAAGTGAYAPAHGPEPQVGQLFAGRYKLREKLGEGGMGVVFVADQLEPVQRRVALKVIKGDHDSKRLIARCEQERQALALMDHPNIAKVFDAGLAADPGASGAGTPYFVMELVKGLPLTKYCDQAKLTAQQRLEMFVPVCQAVQHAHQKGIIHRDLKPSNILIGLYDGRPVPKVIDFGVAKATGARLTEQSVYTEVGTLVGTLEYMSPEQAELNNLDIDTRSDIYALGVILYELLTGSVPFSRKELQSVGFLEMLRVLKEVEPVKPSTKLSQSGALPSVAASRGTEPKKLTALVRGELDWIVMKALEKERSRRYETATGLGADVQRYLAGKVVQAAPPSARYRLKKLLRRNKGPILAGLLLALALVGGTIGTTVGIIWYQGQQAEAARKLVLSEQAAGQALDQAQEGHDNLQKKLRQPGAVFELLNHPQDWQARIQMAQGNLDRARALLASAEDGVDHELKGRAGQLGRLLQQNEADRLLAGRLEKIRMDRAVWVERSFDYKKAGAEYPKVFAASGLGVVSGDRNLVVQRILSTSIKEQVVAALDDWAWVAWYLGNEELPEKLLAVARAVAPDPAWGDRLRQLETWRSQNALAALAKKAPAEALSPQLLVLLGNLLGEEKHLRQTWLRQAQAQFPGDFWLNFDLANALQSSHPVEAAGFYRVALALRPATIAAYNNLGSVLRDQQQLPEAIAAYHKAIKLDPKFARAYMNLGNALRDQKKLPEAIAAYRKAIVIDPKFATAYSNLGVALHDQQKLPEAIAAYRKAISLDPKYAAPCYNLGLALRAQQKLPEAIAAYRKAIDLNPKDARTYYNLGSAFRAQGNQPQAIAAYRKAIDLDPKDASSYYNLGNALYALRKLPEAIAAYRKAIDLNPKDARTYYNLGSAFRAQGNQPQAIAAYRKAIDLDPKDASSYYNLGNALYALRKLPEAIAAYRRAIDLDPKQASRYYMLGIAFFEQNKLPEAIAAFRKAIKVNPAYAEAHCNLGHALLAQGEMAQGLAALRRGDELGRRRADWRYPSAEWVRLAEQLAQLERNLPAILSGTQQPASAGESIQYAQVCHAKGLYAAEARLYEQAFAAEPKLVEDLKTANRFRAACAACLSAAGQGKDSAKLDDKQRAHWRRQAVAWLKADLALWAKQLESGKAQDRALVQRTLRNWQEDADLAGIREAAALAKLPAAEQPACKKLWADVAALLKKAASKP